jgi:ATP-binding cassette subfamily B protein
MSRKKLDFRADAFRQVLGFTFRHWANQPKRIALIAGLVMVATIAEVLVPMFSGRIVDAISGGQDTALNDALRAFAMVAGLGVTSVVLRFFVFNGIIKLTLKMMAQIVNDGFYRVQRFSTDWHANSFAGSTVRKVTRGMWALDALNDILLVALLPSVVMLVGASILLGSYWPVMGLVVALGSVVYITFTVLMSVGFVAPAASLANAWDTRLGGALADAVSVRCGDARRGSATPCHVQVGFPYPPDLAPRHAQRHHSGAAHDPDAGRHSGHGPLYVDDRAGFGR